jgi:uncharacterized membrane protein
MKTISIRTSLKRGWTLFKSHKHALIISLIVLMFLQMMSGNRGGVFYGHVSLIRLLTTLIAFVAVTIVKIGWLKMTLMIEDGGKPKWTEVFAHPEHFIKFAIGSAIYAVGTGLLMILLVIPGIWFAITYCFVPVLIIDKNTGLAESFARSEEMTKGHKWKLFGFFIAATGLIILGVLMLLVGLLVAIPVVGLAFAHIYRTLYEHSGKKLDSEAAEMAL